MFAASKSGRAVSAVTTDPYFPYVPLLLNTTSTNGQQNNTFLDSSSNAFTITRNGTPTQGAFTPYQPNGYWSGYFNGSTDYFTLPSSSALTLTADFTIEFWVYSGAFASGASNPSLFNNASASIFYESNGSNRGLCLYVGSAIITTAITVLPNNQWNHVVCVRSGSTVSMYVNGSRVGTNASFSSTADFSSAYVNRYYASSAGYLNGYMSNLRVVKGTAVYDPTQTTLTVPTAPLTAITNTSLLTLQSNRFIDNSTNAFAITASGTPKVQAFQPFSPAASYSAATYGGSGYFNGSTDYLSSTTASTVLQFGSNPYTIEGWVYQTSRAATQWLCGGQFSGTGFQLGVDTSGFIYVSVPGVSNLTAATIAITLNAWTHFACVRSSTSAGGFTYYINGVAAGTPTDANNYSGTTTTFNIVNTNNGLGGSIPLSGYLSNFRIVKGTAIYTAAFTPPTLPVTAVSGTSLLTNFTNAGIYDAAWQNNALTVGDAQASTTQYKWSPTSMKFDGTGDYLNVITAPALNLSGSDFTIEAWIYLSSIAANGSIVSKYVGSNVGASEFLFWITSTGAIALAIDGGGGEDYIASSAGIFATGSWYYVAVTRSGTGTNNVKIWQNGTQVAQGTSTRTMNVTSTALTVGSVGASSYFNGYIQDLRITKGVARTITTPIAAFPTR